MKKIQVVNLPILKEGNILKHEKEYYLITKVNKKSCQCRHLIKYKKGDAYLELGDFFKFEI